MNVPLLLNFCIRLLPESVTYTFPEESTAIPEGVLNCPSAVPEDPHSVMNVPLLAIFCIRLLPVSVTYTIPEESTAIPEGSRNCPSSEPGVPHFFINEYPFVVCILGGALVAFIDDDDDGALVAFGEGAGWIVVGDGVLP